jgi:hypothetical protein
MSYDTNPYVLMTRECYEVNTDPQRRCYDGCHFSSEIVWTAWSTLDRLPNAEAAARKLKFWRELNDYAVSQRGEGAKREFKIVEQKEVTA